MRFKLAILKTILSREVIGGVMNVIQFGFGYWVYLIGFFSMISFVEGLIFRVKDW